MVWHGDELMQEKTMLLAILLKYVKEQTRKFYFLEERFSCMSDRCNKKRADFLRSSVHFPPALKRVF